MKAFRWLLVHPISFAWLLAAIAILLNYIVGSGAPPKKEHQAKAGQHEMQAQQGAAGHEQASAQAQTAAAMPADHGADATATNAEQATASGEQAPASASVTEQAQATAGTAGTAAATAATDVQVVNDNSSAENLLLAAREAYWSGEYDRSVGFYQSLLKKDNKPDYKGELANVYWKQGKSTEAVGLYAEIAPWLAEQGRVTELQSIKVYADVVDPVKAAEIGAVIK